MLDAAVPGARLAGRDAASQRPRTARIAGVTPVARAETGAC